MPFYEYRCNQCGKLVEFRSSMEKKEEMAATLRCDSCGSGKFVQVLGGFAMTHGSGGGSDIPPPQVGGGGCPGGMCGL